MAKMDDMMAQMRAKMANLPPDQRAMIEQMAKQNGVLNFGTAAPQKPAVYDAQPTGGADTINGRACKLWNVTSRRRAEQASVRRLVKARCPERMKSWRLRKRCPSCSAKWANACANRWRPDWTSRELRSRKLRGYPLMSRAYNDGKLPPEQFIVKTWTQQSVEPGKFEIPKDFVKQELPQIPLGLSEKK